jgi:hypothetical protein
VHYKVIKAIKTEQATIGGKTFAIIWSTYVSSWRDVTDFCDINKFFLFFYPTFLANIFIWPSGPLSPIISETKWGSIKMRFDQTRFEQMRFDQNEVRTNEFQSNESLSQRFGSVA